MAPRRLVPVPPIVHPWVDARRSPLLTTAWPRTSSVEEIDAYMKVVSPWMHGIESRWATTLDFSRFDASSSTASQRRAFAAGGRALLPLLGAHCAAVGIAAPSAIARGVVQAVLWFVAPPCAVRVFDTHEEALTWTEAELVGGA